MNLVKIIMLSSLTSMLLLNLVFANECKISKDELFEATRKSDYKAIETFVQIPCDLAMLAHNYNLDLLEIAVQNNDLRMAKLFIINHFDINKINQYGTLSISSCVSVDMADLLIKKGIRLDYHDKEGMSPLHDLILSSRLKIAKFIIQHGANVNAKDSIGFTPLMFACQMEPVSFVKFLLDSGAVVNAKKADRQTALHLAVLRGNIDIVNILIQAGADINCRDRRGNTPLHMAATDGNEIITRILIKKGANVNVVNDRSNTPLWNAINLRPYPGRVKKENRKGVIDLLKEAGGI